MALNVEVIGQKLGPIDKCYNFRDVILYALGVGAGFSELPYVYEKDLKVIPTFGMASIFDFFFHVGTAAQVNPAGILHGEQDLFFHAPIPVEGVLTTTGEITHLVDKGKDKGSLIIARSDTLHSGGAHLFTSVLTMFARLDGGFGEVGEKPPVNDIQIPETEPDVIVTEKPGENQPLIYRLSGDYFPLHVDPEFAAAAGFEKPIMHGLCTLGFSCRALMGSMIPLRPERLRRLRCRFTRPLYPGREIQTRIWKTDAGRAIWNTVNAETGEVIIDKGGFEYEERI